MQTYLWLVAAAGCQQTGRWRQACEMPRASGCPRRRMESCPEHSPAQSTSNTISSSHLLHKAQATQSHPHKSSTKHKQYNLAHSPQQRATNTISLCLRGQAVQHHSTVPCSLPLTAPSKVKGMQQQNELGHYLEGTGRLSTMVLSRVKSM